MNYKPIKYKQPLFGDSRCALYSLANVLGDMGMLLFNNVGEETTHNEEHIYLRAVCAVMQQPPWGTGGIEGIYPYAIAPNHASVPYEWVEEVGLFDEPDMFAVALIDLATLLGTADVAHTVAALWYGNEELAIIDPQKDFIAPISKKRFFNTTKVVGVRFLHNEQLEVQGFKPAAFPHLFNLAPAEAVAI